MENPPSDVERRPHGDPLFALPRLAKHGSVAASAGRARQEAARRAAGAEAPLGPARAVPSTINSADGMCTATVAGAVLAGTGQVAPCTTVRRRRIAVPGPIARRRVTGSGPSGERGVRAGPAARRTTTRRRTGPDRGGLPVIVRTAGPGEAVEEADGDVDGAVRSCAVPGDAVVLRRRWAATPSAPVTEPESGCECGGPPGLLRDFRQQQAHIVYRCVLLAVAVHAGRRPAVRGW